MRLRDLALLVTTALTAAALAAPAQAQSTAALTGQVSSQEEGAMEGVLVSAHKDGSTVTVTVVSDAQGHYSFPAARLEPGHYSLTIRAGGYALEPAQSADVAAGATATADLKLAKTKHLASELSNAEWIMSVPGSDQQKMALTNCVSCHTLERIVLKARPEVFFEQTLWGERRAIYASQPAWLDERLLRETLSAKEIEGLSQEFSGDDTPVARRARERAQTNLHNTARLNAAGVILTLGTDTGGVTGGQYFGLGTQIEMELQVTKAGLTPMQALVSGTRTAAHVVGLDELGTVAPGKKADFIVLDANPLDDIANTRKIARVYLNGQEFSRAAMRERWRTE
jgi:mono/diheme cytochrome c family protein